MFSSRFSLSDFFIMPIFSDNWPSLVAVLIGYLLIKRKFFNTHKVSIISLFLILLYSSILAAPFQSFWALKLWSLSDQMVLRIIFPLSAFTTTLIFGFLLLSFHMKVTKWWLSRKKIKKALA